MSDMEMTAASADVRLKDHNVSDHGSLDDSPTKSIKIGQVWRSLKDPVIYVKIFSNDCRVTYYPIDYDGVTYPDDVDGIYDDEMTTFRSMFYNPSWIRSNCKTP